MHDAPTTTTPSAATLDEETPRKYGRNTDGTFAKGNPGKPVGSRNKTTVLAESLLTDETEAIMRTLVDHAIKGFSGAQKLCLDRLVPLKRERTVAVDLPVVENAADAIKAAGQLAALVGSGDLTPGEGRTLAAIVETQAKLIATQELQQRLAAVESAINYLRVQVSDLQGRSDLPALPAHTAA